MKVKCERCADTLEWIAQFSQEHILILRVKPCLRCLVDEYKAGLERGQRDNKKDGNKTT